MALKQRGKSKQPETGTACPTDKTAEVWDDDVVYEFRPHIPSPGTELEPVEEGMGSVYLGDFKIKEYRGCARHIVDTRDHHYDVYLIYEYPTPRDIENIVRNCAIGCGIATLIAAVATGGTGSAAAALFVDCVIECVNSQVAGSISAELRVEDMGPDDWSGH